MFGFLRKKKEEPASPQKRMTLYGFDLNLWHYMGYTEINYSQGKDIMAAFVYFFVNKDDESIRDYAIRSKYQNMLDYNNHPWILTKANIWRIGGLGLYDSVHTAPSEYLRNRVSKEHGQVWDDEKKWWVHSADVKYDNAKDKQQKKKKPKVQAESNNNVVSVDFKKEEE